MKKVLLAIVFLTAGAIASQAQIKYGLKAGANFYQIGGSDADDFKEDRKMKIGLAGGAFVNIPINETFSVQPELLYSMEGNLQKYEEMGVDVKTSYNLSYINIPVLVQYNASGFYAETGPQIGFLMSAKGKVEVDGEEVADEDIKESLKSINVSWAIGLGYKLKSGIGFGARYNLGLTSIADADDTKVTSSGFHVGISYTFGGDK